jgi:autoinducer 2 (AI-2) kinase
MSDACLLALDAGTTSGRALVVRVDGRVLASARRSWGYDTPEDLAPLGRSFDPDHFWRLLVDAAREALARAPGAEIAGVAATSQREGIVLLDRADDVLFASPNLDLRALMEGFAIDAEHAGRVYEVTGHLPSLMFLPARLHWLRAQEPALLERTGCVLTLDGWITHMLCGERIGERAAAAELGLVDLRSGRWSEELMELLALPSGLYPPLVAAGTAVGKLTATAAQALSMPEGTVVAAAGADTHCATLAMRVLEPGDVSIVAGSTGPVQMALDRLALDERRRIWTGLHPLPGRWLLESTASEAGSAYRWLGEMAFRLRPSNEGKTFAAMDREALGYPPGAAGVSAFLGPCHMDMTRLALRRGGVLLHTPLSAAPAARGQIARAAIENLAFAFRANVEQLSEISGLPPARIVFGGGLSQSECLRQVLPAVLGGSLELAATAETSALGASMCAAVGAGLYPGMRTAAAAMGRGGASLQPDAAAALEYEDLYRSWTREAEALSCMSEAAR